MSFFPIRLYVWACACTLIITLLGNRFFFEEWLNRTFLVGFLLTMGHGFLVFYAHARAGGEAQGRFFYWALGIHAARITLIPLLFLLLHVLRLEHLMQFIATVLVGYFVFLSFEIAGLALMSRDSG